MPKRLNGHSKRPSRDPILEEIFEAMTEHKVNLTTVAEKSGLSRSTLYHWKNGRTKHPQHITCKFALNTMGLDLGIVPIRNRR